MLRFGCLKSVQPWSEWQKWFLEWKHNLIFLSIWLEQGKYFTIPAAPDSELNLINCSCLHLNGADGRRLSVRIFKIWTADWEDFCRWRNCYVASWSWVVCGISPPLLYWQIPFITTLPSMPSHISRVNSFSSPPLASLDSEYYSTLGKCSFIIINSRL